MSINNGFPTNLPSLQGLRILVVDNSIDCGDLMTVMLQPYDVEIKVAFLVQQAVEIFVQWQPDVLVSEIALPKEDGYALIRQVRTLTGERGKEVLAIAVTAQGTKEMSQRVLSAGFDLWFTKPLNFDDFLAVLGCLAICQQSSYAIAQHILGVPRHDALSLEKQLELTFLN
ncbi:response regulator [Microseira wollei]|uniref:Response regulator receiver protein n=1 Tax=Microseira wollei NIES-4236 TaxID=2530354 RepID=A0AAV3X542_9CYAN|nr:response regulator [Microseira wollei]GET35302.1 response regulator receiver protein [Microseira wollei NIES-4236]